MANVSQSGRDVCKFMAVTLSFQRKLDWLVEMLLELDEQRFSLVFLFFRVHAQPVRGVCYVSKRRKVRDVCKLLQL